MDTKNRFSMDNLTNCHASGKWTPLVLYLLRDGRPQRYSQLKRQMGRVSQKMLTQTLRQLEQKRIVSRKIHATVPATVDYKLTALGKRVLQPILQIMKRPISRRVPGTPEDSPWCS
jgi:DNA-binding HxlR family transcriptional regulator